MLRLEGIHAGYATVPVLHGVSIMVEAGAFVSMVGPNGAGKTTLFKTISGTVRPSAGSIAFEDTDHYRLMREFILDWRTTVETMLDG